jgi:hypothetical protein
MRTVGRLLVQLLADVLDGAPALPEQDRPEIHHLVRPELIARASTGGA